MDSPAAPRKGIHIPKGPVIAVFVVLLVWALSVPPTHNLLRAQAVHSLNNGRQIYLATANMAADGLQEQDPHLGWPGDVAASPVDPVSDLASFAERLNRSGYINDADLGLMFAAPGVTASHGQGKFSGANSGFKIYLVTANDDPKTLFLATKNFTFGLGLDPHALPYRDKAFVIVRKGGDGIIMGKPQALDKAQLGYMPSHRNPEDPGLETSGNVWKE